MSETKGITISTHNGSTVSLAHNRREKWLIEKENEKWQQRHPGELRIDPTKEDIILKDGNLNQAYEEIFGPALKEWNEKQIQSGKKERVIINYLSHIRSKQSQSKNAKKPIYEIIYSIGSQENPVDENLAKKILLEHYQDFSKRNPSLYVVGAYMHVNSERMGPHIHVSYIPVAKCSRGMSVQNGLTRALEQDGIVSTSKSLTAQILWERKENEALETLCMKHGLTVLHPQRGTKVEHLTIEEYKLEQEVKQRQEEIEMVKALPLGKTIVSKARLQQLEQAEKELESSRPILMKAKKDIQKSRTMFEAYDRKYEELVRLQLNEESRINEVANQKISQMKKNSLSFIKELGLWDTFLTFQQKQVERLEAKIK